MADRIVAIRMTLGDPQGHVSDVLQAFSNVICRIGKT